MILQVHDGILGGVATAFRTHDASDEVIIADTERLARFVRSAQRSFAKLRGPGPRAEAEAARRSPHLPLTRLRAA